tara:strand:- start:12168 stop:12854 length:687 start_codon:yes stop_codon:yes gene_type:complete
LPAPISVIIPTLNSEAELEACMNMLLPGLTANLVREVIIVDGGSNDRTGDLAFQWGARLICASGKGRGRQLRTGGLNAKGEWLLFLHSDTWLDQDWPDHVEDHMRTAPDMAAAFSLRYRSKDKQARWLENRANKRARVLGLPYGDQGLFMSRAHYDRIGGFEDMPLMEDVDIVRRIGKKNLAILPGKAFTSAEKYERDGWRKRAYSNAFLLMRYYLGASPEKLAQDYR